MNRDQAVFQALAEEHGAAALALLLRLCGNPHDADDLFQEVAVRVWRNLASLPRLRSARAWLLTIAYHVFLDHEAKRPRHARLVDDGSFARGGTDRDPAVLVERAERAQIVNSAVADLPVPLRSVITLHYTGGLSLRQVASTMELSVGTVKSRLNVALEQLRRQLT